MEQLGLVQLSSVQAALSDCSQRESMTRGCKCRPVECGVAGRLLAGCSCGDDWKRSEGCVVLVEDGDSRSRGVAGA